MFLELLRILWILLRMRSSEPQNGILGDDNSISTNAAIRVVNPGGVQHKTQVFCKQGLHNSHYSLN